VKRPYLIPVALTGAAFALVLSLRLLGVGRVGDPDEARSRLAEARRLRKEGKADEALRLFEQAVAFAPNDLEVNREYQNAMREAGRLEEVRARYDKRAVQNPRDPLSLYLAARLKPRDEIEAGMRRVLEHSPGFPPAHRTLGELARERKDYPAAEKHLAVCARSTYASRDDLIALILMAHAQNDVTRVGEWLRRWREIATGANPADMVWIPLLGETDSIILCLSDARDAGAYLFHVSRQDRGTRVVGAVRTKDGTWAVVESPGWTRHGERMPPVDDLFAGAKGEHAGEPDYALVFGRAMRYFREE
jgi:tetratricopeptide (TPR) repeat protein